MNRQMTWGLARLEEHLSCAGIKLSYGNENTEPETWLPDIDLSSESCDSSCDTLRMLGETKERKKVKQDKRRRITNEEKVKGEKNELKSIWANLRLSRML